MLKCTVEDLERILNETNYLKHSLSIICEESWDLLCPPGTQSRGSFQIVKNTPSCDSDHLSEVDGTIVTPAGNSIKHVDEIINYGKEIRSKLKFENNKCLNHHDFLGAHSNAENTNIAKSTHSEKLLLQKQEKNVSRHPKKIVKQSVHIPTKPTFDFDKEENPEGSTTRKYSKNKDSPSTSSSNCVDNTNKSLALNSKTSNTLKYSHSCSFTLSDYAKTLKMPENLKHLLKHYYYYENNKLKYTSNDEKQKMCNYTERLNFLIKSRLKSNLKDNVKQGERYLKYLDVASETGREGTVDTKLQYNSEKQLTEYEARVHFLLELQLQRRLMNAISDIISNKNV